MSTGLGFTTFSATEFDTPPPGGVKFVAGGFSTAISTGPAAVMSEACRATVSCVLDTNAVVRFAPSTVAIETLWPGTPTKFDPLIVMFPPCVPAAMEFGVIDEICGTGSAVGVMVSVTIFEVPPPGGGVITKMLIVPEARTSPGFTKTVNSVSERKIVARGRPLKFTVELGANPEPFTASVNVVDSAATLAGVSVEIAGTGKLTTPPQEVKSSIPTINAAVESFERKLKPVFLPHAFGRLFEDHGNQKEY